MSTPIQNILVVAGRVRAPGGCFHLPALPGGPGWRGPGASLACASLASETASRGTSFPATTRSALGGRRSGFVRAVALRDFRACANAQVIHVHGARLRYPEAVEEAGE